MAGTILVCSCEDTMPLDGKALARGCGPVKTAEQLCIAQLDRFMAALAAGGPVTVGCTEKAPLFRDEAEAAGAEAALTFVNLREQAGWSRDAAGAGPKMAALIAAAQQPMPAVPLVPLRSDGVALILGRDAVALGLAQRLKDRLDLTVLLTAEEPVPPLPGAEFPVLRGRAKAVTGYLGAFEVAVDGVAMPRPSSRAAYEWGPASAEARTSRCDLVIDLTGGAPMVPAHEVRPGYLRADPADRAAVETLAAKAEGLVGTFDKPRFVTFEAGLCAHSRNRRTGCTRCLDLCPTGAITPGKDSVAISAEICAGCGSCAAVCPTGAATYALPPTDALLRRIRALLLTYREAGGEAPVLLLHDEAQGEPLIDALARYGDGLPARVLSLRVNEVTALDLGILAAALAYGATAIRVLMPAHRRHGAEGLFRNFGTLDTVLSGLGLAPDVPRLGAIETDDPFTLGEALTALPRAPLPFAPATFLPLGTPREIARTALRALHDGAAPAADIIPLPDRAPFGEARIATDACTLCLACTGVCPTSALSANPETPQLRFLEEACVQCGLCAATCPEKAITLVPRLSFAAEAATPRLVKEEPPALCTRCAKPFGTAGSIARVKAKLAAHWMFTDPKRVALLEMCEDCRVLAATEGGIDPYAAGERPAMRTTEDYLREAERAKSRGEN